MLHTHRIHVSMMYKYPIHLLSNIIHTNPLYYVLPSSHDLELPNNYDYHGSKINFYTLFIDCVWWQSTSTVLFYYYASFLDQMDLIMTKYYAEISCEHQRTCGLTKSNKNNQQLCKITKNRIIYVHYICSQFCTEIIYVPFISSVFTWTKILFNLNHI